MNTTAPHPEVDDRNEAAVTAAREAYRPAYEQGLDSDVASCAEWFGWHAAIAAARAQFATEDRDLLAEMRERLSNADRDCAYLANQGRTSPEEAARLRGKAEGVRLAISYLDEMVRGL